MHQTDEHGIDSYVEEFTNRDIDLDFDYGMYSEAPHEEKAYLNFKSRTELIDGRNATISSFELTEEPYRYVMIVHFEKERLNMKAYNAMATNSETALKIFRSIKFKNDDRKY